MFIVGVIIGAVLGVVGAALFFGARETDVFEVLRAIKRFCETHQCRECPFWNGRNCLFDNGPLIWPIDESGERK